VHCKACQFDLRHTTEKRCPECGAIFDRTDPTTYLDLDWLAARRRAAISLVCLGVLGTVGGFFDESAMDGQRVYGPFFFMLPVMGVSVWRGHARAAVVASALSVCCACCALGGIVLSLTWAARSQPGLTYSILIPTGAVITFAWAVCNVRLLRRCLRAASE
jgi:hypothetical protein